MIDLALFRVVVAPEFAAMTDDQINLFGTEAEIEVAERIFGPRYPRACCLITAHLIAMAKKAEKLGGVNSTGQVIKTKVGDLERQYSNDSMNGAVNSYDLTSYGKEFKRLRQQCLMTPLFVSC